MSYFCNQARSFSVNSSTVTAISKTVAGISDDDPMGRRHYWFTVVPLKRHAEGTDLWAVAEGYVSLTPLRLDLTAHEELARVATDGRFAQAG